ncbi:MAG: hypothetical protein JETCAE02_27010 [Anaerolineaceae bacterium]|nr:MAG: hypothetical protein JETCAE02_27010 [Anaerolineaceae bacterium]
MTTISLNEVIRRLRALDLTPGQRAELNCRVRNLQQRRGGGGRLHHPSHYVPYIRALAKKHGILVDGVVRMRRVR